MIPILKTLPAVGPSPPEISILCLCIMWEATSFQFTPSGTFTVVTVGSLSSGFSTKSSRPILSSPDQSLSAASRCLVQASASPSSCRMLRASLRVYMFVTIPVWWYHLGLSSNPQYSPRRFRSKQYVKGLVFLCLSLAMAAELTIRGEAPGGAPKHFWEPLYVMSTPCLSTLKGTQPRVQTVSRKKSAPCLLHASPMPSIGWRVPVEDSPCVRKTSPISGFATSSLSTSSGWKTWPPGFSSLTTTPA
mmetsp:Transcript_384/g.1418  ORF Transcript_384/g.1418 Transcript_384/m.1418 type:complete len:247 (-) Transcript_384:462-1202(-)